MPNNTEAEAAVLGSILIDNNAADNLIPVLREDDFYLAPNRIIFAAMKTLQGQSKAIDTVTVADELELEGKLDEVGSIAYLSELAEGVISAANGDYYAEILKRDSLIRRVITTGNEIAKYGYDCDDGIKALDNAERLIYKIAEDSSEKALVKADAAFAMTMSNIQSAQVGKATQATVDTGFPTFERATKGLKPGELILIAARPSVGKTAFALNLAVNVALRGVEHKTVAIFSLEMSSMLLAKRMLAYESGVTFDAMDSMGGLRDKNVMDRLMKAYRRLAAANIYIDDYSMNSPADILSKCRRLKREKGLDLIIVDYLQLMRGNSSGNKGFESRQVEVSDMTRMMKIYAKELDCPIILLSQMSRGIEQRKDEPMLSDLRESGAIEQDADVVAFLHNPSKYNSALPQDEIKLFIKKNRNGPLADITLNWDGATTTFKEIVSRSADELREPSKPAEPTRQVEQASVGGSEKAGAAAVAGATVNEDAFARTNGGESGSTAFSNAVAKTDGEDLPFDLDKGDGKQAAGEAKAFGDITRGLKDVVEADFPFGSDMPFGADDTNDDDEDDEYVDEDSLAEDDGENGDLGF